MKVIKTGRKQKGWAKEYECTGKGNSGGGCGAIILVEQDDLFQTTHSCYDGSSDYFITFKCCECGVMTDIPSQDYCQKVQTYKEWEAKHKIEIIEKIG